MRLAPSGPHRRTACQKNLAASPPDLPFFYSFIHLFGSFFAMDTKTAVLVSGIAAGVGEAASFFLTRSRAHAEATAIEPCPALGARSEQKTLMLAGKLYEAWCPLLESEREWAAVGSRYLRHL
jgi:hypothetical protein